jgi:hypothetical protein
LNTDSAIDALHLAVALPSLATYPRATELSERQAVASWKRDVVRRRRPCEHPYLNVFASEITTDVPDISNVSPVSI